MFSNFNDPPNLIHCCNVQMMTTGLNTDIGDFHGPCQTGVIKIELAMQAQWGHRASVRDMHSQLWQAQKERVHILLERQE